MGEDDDADRPDDIGDDHGAEEARVAKYLVRALLEEGLSLDAIRDIGLSLVETDPLDGGTPDAARVISRVFLEEGRPPEFVLAVGLCMVLATNEMARPETSA